MAIARFTVEIDLTDEVTEGLFRQWVLGRIKDAYARLDPEAALHSVDISTLRMTTVNPPDRFAIHRPQNFVVAEEVQSNSRLHRQGEIPVKVFKTSLKPRW